MVGIYIRVSTEKQRDNYSYQDQESQGRDFAKGEQLKIYKEAKSGKSLSKRLEWRRLEQDILSGEIDKIWVLDNKRFSRNMKDAVNMLYFCKEHNIELFIGGRFLDYENSSDVFTFQINQAVAEKEGKDIKDRGTQMLHACMNAGNFNYTRLYGYNFKLTGKIGKGGRPEKEYFIVPEQAETIRYIFDLFVNVGMSLRQICFKINREGHKGWAGNHFEYSKISRTILQLEYSGRARKAKKYKDQKKEERDIIKSNVYEPIISVGMFNRAQRLMEKTPGRSFDKHVSYMCSNLVKCSTCGSGYYHHKIKDWDYYLHHEYGQKCGQRPKSINKKLLDKIFFMLYIRIITEYQGAKILFDEKQSEIIKEKSKVEKDIERIGKRIEGLEKKKDSILIAIADCDPGKDKGLISDYNNNAKKIYSEIEDDKSTITELSRSVIKKQESYKLMLAEFSWENIKIFTGAPPSIRRNMLKRLFEKIEINGKIIHCKVITGQVFDLDIKEMSEQFKQAPESLFSFLENLITLRKEE